MQLKIVVSQITKWIHWIQRPGTLALQQPIWKTTGLSAVIFIVLILVGEGVSRTKLFQMLIIRQTWGSSHSTFDTQLSRINQLVNQEGPIECIFLGNSMVWLGFDPQAFQEGYLSKTGELIHCFNFGVDGMPASSAGLLASVLTEDFQPSMLIYGTDARDYAVPRIADDARVLSEMPWLQYRLGRFTWPGWLAEHSYLFRYRIALKHLLRLEDRYTMFGDYDQFIGNRYGFDPDDTIGDIRKAPVPEDPSRHIQYYYQLLSIYKMLPENLTGLQQILDANEYDVQVLLVEMPVPETYISFFGRDEEDYAYFIDQISNMAHNNGVIFWQSRFWNIIPSDGWVDYSHLNRQGAEVFSRALGEKVGEAVLSGQIQDPVK